MFDIYVSVPHNGGMTNTKRIAHLAGHSTTGTSHGLLLELASDAVKLTITGANGTKRHASIVMDAASIDSAIAALIEAKGMLA